MAVWQQFQNFQNLYELSKLLESPSPDTRIRVVAAVLSSYPCALTAWPLGSFETSKKLLHKPCGMPFLKIPTNMFGMFTENNGDSSLIPSYNESGTCPFDSYVSM